MLFTVSQARIGPKDTTDAKTHCCHPNEFLAFLHNLFPAWSLEWRAFFSLGSSFFTKVRTDVAAELPLVAPIDNNVGSALEKVAELREIFLHYCDTRSESFIVQNSFKNSETRQTFPRHSLVPR